MNKDQLRENLNELQELRLKLTWKLSDSPSDTPPEDYAKTSDDLQKVKDQIKSTQLQLLQSHF